MLIRYWKDCAEVVCRVVIHIALIFGKLMCWFVCFVFVHCYYEIDTIYCCNLFIFIICLNGYIVVGSLGTYF